MIVTIVGKLTAEQYEGTIGLYAELGLDVEKRLSQMPRRNLLNKENYDVVLHISETKSSKEVPGFTAGSMKAQFFLTTTCEIVSFISEASTATRILGAFETNVGSADGYFFSMFIGNVTHTWQREETAHFIAGRLAELI